MLDDELARAFVLLAAALLHLVRKFNVAVDCVVVDFDVVFPAFVIGGSIADSGERITAVVLDVF